MNDSVAHTTKANMWRARGNALTIAITFSKLIDLSSSFYGKFLLSLAILLSAFSHVYLKTIYREQMQLLQSSQAYYEALEEKRSRLQVEHEALSSTPRLQALSKKLDLITPDIAKIEQILTI